MPTLMFMRRPASVIGRLGLELEQVLGASMCGVLLLAVDLVGLVAEHVDELLHRHSTSPGCATQPPS